MACHRIAGSASSNQSISLTAVGYSGPGAAPSSTRSTIAWASRRFTGAPVIGRRKGNRASSQVALLRLAIEPDVSWAR